MLQTLFLLLATAVGWRPSLLADTNLAVGTVSLWFGTVCCLLVPDGYQMGNCGQWFHCVPVPKITAYRVSLVSRVLNGTSKQHSEKSQHLFLTPNDLKNVADILSFSQELLCICRKNTTLQMPAAIKLTLANGSSRSLHLNSVSQHWMWGIINVGVQTYFKAFFKQFSAVRWKNKKTINLKGLWKAAEIPEGQS